MGRSYRLRNIDLMRGFVIVLMALDHARTYFHYSDFMVMLDDPDINVMLYFTRWVTHFCAPVFVFLAGTSIGLMSERRTKREIADYVIKRGLWLIFLEIVVMTIISTTPLGGEPQLDGKYYVVMQVLWALGGGIVLVGIFQFFGERICLLLGIIIICTTDAIAPMMEPSTGLTGGNSFWMTFYAIGSYDVGPALFAGLYPLIPWTGIMFLGYGSTFIFRKESREQNADLIKYGLLMIVCFVLLRGFIGYGEPNVWITENKDFFALFLDIFNVTKYPPSLQYCLITLGPMAIMCAYSSNIKGWLGDTLIMFGRVPLLFFVLHFALLHFLAMSYGVFQGYEASQFAGAFRFFPDGYGTSLFGAYVVWILIIVILYPVCYWYSSYKDKYNKWWTSYL